MSENGIIMIGQMDNTKDHTFESANRVYGTDGIAPTVPTCAGGGIQPKVLEVKCLNSKGGRNGVEGLQPSLQDRVYDPEGISYAMTTSFQPSIIEKSIVAMRGRDPQNSSDRTSGNPNLEQTLEPNSEGICNTLTTVQKDNMVLEMGYIEKGTGKHQSNVVYSEDGLSPTICASYGVKQPPAMIVEKRLTWNQEEVALSRAEQSRAEQSRAA